MQNRLKKGNVDNPATKVETRLICYYSEIENLAGEDEPIASPNLTETLFMVEEIIVEAIVSACYIHYFYFRIVIR